MLLLSRGLEQLAFLCQEDLGQLAAGDAELLGTGAEVAVYPSQLRLRLLDLLESGILPPK